MGLRQEVFHLAVDGGQRLCIWRAPGHGSLRGVIVHVPAFAEEMNKCRPMVALAARRLAASGFGVLEIDLLGCGDSTGDFADASFDAWIDDIVAAVRWVRGRDDAALWLWGVRAGALLAAAATRHLAEAASVLLWQPVLSGRVMLSQFLRLKLAADALAGDGARAGTRQLRAELARGTPVDIAGYRLTPALAAGIEASALAFAPTVRRVEWLEVSGAAQPVLGPAALAAVATLSNGGMPVHATVVGGPGFWQTVEIEMCPMLVDATVTALMESPHDGVPRDTVLR
ncbi:MAG TPA: hydrolase 2, exosortase A system-associated [Casimicrobiaceae bacterium]|nr:hydrolase 2, exosortase A system-associated [Casimicrobiaceae bacterium]